jgi:hypothetical protein
MFPLFLTESFFDEDDDDAVDADDDDVDGDDDDNIPPQYVDTEVEVLFIM